MEHHRRRALLAANQPTGFVVADDDHSAQDRRDLGGDRRARCHAHRLYEFDHNFAGLIDDRSVSNNIGKFRQLDDLVGRLDLDLPAVGWVLGEGRAGCSACLVIKNTINGGRSWSAVPAPRGGLPGPTSEACVRLGGCIGHLLFVNRHDGYLYGPGLFTTTDGGRTWRRQAGKQTEALATVAPGVVWRLAYDHDGCPGPCDVILQQQRAGSTRWTTVRAPFDDTLTGVSPQIVSIGAARILIVFYGNLASGFPSSASFYIADDQGRSWTTRTDPCGFTGSTENNALETSATGQGTVVVECLAKGDSNDRFIVVSRDGGQTFGPRHRISSNDSIIAAASPSAIVAATGDVSGEGPITYTVDVTSDGGAKWRTVVRDRETLVDTMPGESFLAFASLSVAHWIGYGNKLWTTTDAGRHWTSSSL